MRSPVSQRDASDDQEVLAVSYALSREDGHRTRTSPAAQRRSELPQTLLYGLPAAAAYLGLTPTQLQVWLEYGGPLETIARAQGRPTDGVIDIFVKRAAASLGLLVAAGWLAEAQQATLLVELDHRLGAAHWEASRSRSAA